MATPARLTKYTNFSVTSGDPKLQLASSATHSTWLLLPSLISCFNAIVFPGLEEPTTTRFSLKAGDATVFPSNPSSFHKVSPFTKSTHSTTPFELINNNSLSSFTARVGVLQETLSARSIFQEFLPVSFSILSR